MKARVRVSNTAQPYCHLPSVTQTDDTVHECIETTQNTLDRSAAIQLDRDILVHVLLQLWWVDLRHGGLGFSLSNVREYELKGNTVLSNHLS